jgi:sporulation protein YlmC with PRC-barrel domain
MRNSLLMGGLLATAMMVPALAQSNPPANEQRPAATAPAPAKNATVAIAPKAQSNLWRASKLIGVNVYNEQNEKLGDISEILLDKSGKVDGVVIGVGGFLGMGRHDIKVEMSKLKFVDEPVRTSATNSNSATTTGTATRSTTTASSTDNGQKWYPDHAILSGASKDQLKNMPQFKYD